MKKRARTTNYSVSAGASTGDGVFREIRLPDGDIVRIMDRDVFERAVSRANSKFSGTVGSVVRRGDKRNELIGKIQERYGYPREEAERQVDEWIRGNDNSAAKATGQSTVAGEGVQTEEMNEVSSQDPTASGTELHYNPIFEKLVEIDGQEELIGLIAYGRYKRAKKIWASNFHARRKNSPSNDDLNKYAKDPGPMIVCRPCSK